MTLFACVIVWIPVKPNSLWSMLQQEVSTWQNHMHCFLSQSSTSCLPKFLFGGKNLFHFMWTAKTIILSAKISFWQANLVLFQLGCQKYHIVCQNSMLTVKILFDIGVLPKVLNPPLLFSVLLISLFQQCPKCDLYISKLVCKWSSLKWPPTPVHRTEYILPYPYMWHYSLLCSFLPSSSPFLMGPAWQENPNQASALHQWHPYEIRTLKKLISDHKKHTSFLFLCCDMKFGWGVLVLLEYRHSENHVRTLSRV